MERALTGFSEGSRRAFEKTVERALSELSERALRGLSESCREGPQPAGCGEGFHRAVTRALRKLSRELSEGCREDSPRAPPKGCREDSRRARQGLQAALKNLNFIPGRGVYFYGFDSSCPEHSENVSKTYKKR